MKETIFILCTILLFLSIDCFSQDFKTKLYFEDSLGNLDSIQIGYAKDATTFGIDPQYGEINIISIPRSKPLDVRASSEWGDGIWGELYHSKVEIGQLDCNDNYRNLIFKIDILADNWPIRIFWNHDEFMNECLNYSVISDRYWPHWFDVAPLNNGHKCFTEPGDFIYTKHNSIDYNHTLVDTITGDTIFFLFLGLGNELINNSTIGGNNCAILTSTNKVIEEELWFRLYPNPANNYINIESKLGLNRLGGKDDLTIEVESINGQTIIREVYSLDMNLSISDLTSGLYLIKLKLKDELIFVEKFIKL